MAGEYTEFTNDIGGWPGARFERRETSVKVRRVKVEPADAYALPENKTGSRG